MQTRIDPAGEARAAVLLEELASRKGKAFPAKCLFVTFTLCTEPVELVGDAAYGPLLAFR